MGRQLHETIPNNSFINLIVLQIIFSAIIGLAACQSYAGLGGFGHLQGAQPHPSQQYAPPAPVGRDGSVIDTPEVAQAKAAHFAEFAKAAARAASTDIKPNGVFGSEGRSGYASYPAPVGHSAPSHYAQPSFVAPSNIYNSIKPRPEIAYPRNYESPIGHNFASVGPIPKNYVSAGPAKANFIPAPLAEDGTVIDTPEVAALKAVRLQELAEAEARAYKFGGNEEYPGINQEYSGAPGAPVPAYPGHFGAAGSAGRFQSPSNYPTQSFAASVPFNSKYQSAPVYQPHSYQSQQLVGTY